MELPAPPSAPPVLSKGRGSSTCQNQESSASILESSHRSWPPSPLEKSLKTLRLGVPSSSSSLLKPLGESRARLWWSKCNRPLLVACFSSRLEHQETWVIAHTAPAHLRHSWPDLAASIAYHSESLCGHVTWEAVMSGCWPLRRDLQT